MIADIGLRLEVDRRDAVDVRGVEDAEIVAQGRAHANVGQTLAFLLAQMVAVDLIGVERLGIGLAARALPPVTVPASDRVWTAPSAEGGERGACPLSRYRQFTLRLRSIARPASAPPPAPSSVPSKPLPRGAMTLPSSPPPTPPTIKPVVPSPRRQ